MREIHVSAITDTVAELAVAACCRLPDVMYRAIESSVEREASPSGKDVLRQLLLNADIAASENTPICQDTGLAVVFAEVGQDVHVVGGSFEEAVNAGVAKGYTEGYLRKSSVAEPLFERKNTGDNTPAVLHVRLVPGDRIRLKLAPKGAGSENKSALKMLVPADGIEGVKKFVVDTVKAAGSSRWWSAWASAVRLSWRACAPSAPPCATWTPATPIPGMRPLRKSSSAS